VARDESTARNPLGAAGGYLIENFKRLRELRKLTYTELSAELKKVGRPIPVLGLSRIEKGLRRVDVDDLIALAIVFRVSPGALLLPRTGNAGDEIELTPDVRRSLLTLWLWADGGMPLPAGADEKLSWPEYVDFLVHGRPQDREIPRPHEGIVQRMLGPSGFWVEERRAAGTPAGAGAISAPAEADDVRNGS